MLRWRANDRARWKGWGTCFFTLAGEEKGEHGERGVRGYSQTLTLAKPKKKRCYDTKLRCKQVQLPHSSGQSGIWLGLIRGQSTNGDFLRVDSGPEEWRLPAVQLVQRVTGQLQPFVVLIHVPAIQCSVVRQLQKRHFLANENSLSHNRATHT